MDVAQLRQDCKAFLSAFLPFSRACICAASLASLSGSRLTVSARKLNFQPHQTRESPRAAFFQEIRLLRQTRRTTSRASCRSPLLRRRAASRSST